MSSTVDKVWATLEHLTDPEIPVVTLRELGILREVRIFRMSCDVIHTSAEIGVLNPAVSPSAGVDIPG